MHHPPLRGQVPIQGRKLIHLQWHALESKLMGICPQAEQLAFLQHGVGNDPAWNPTLDIPNSSCSPDPHQVWVPCPTNHLPHVDGEQRGDIRPIWVLVQDPVAAVLEDERGGNWSHFSSGILCLWSHSHPCPALHPHSPMGSYSCCWAPTNWWLGRFRWQDESSPPPKQLWGSKLLPAPSSKSPV